MKSLVIDLILGRGKADKLYRRAARNYTLSEHYSHFCVYTWLAMKFKLYVSSVELSQVF